MLNEQTIGLLNNMRLPGMAKALREQMDHAEKYMALCFEERVGLLIDQEHTDRESRKLTRRLQQAHLRDKACIEDIDYRQTRGLDKSVMRRLATCDWIAKHQNVIITGATGAGKTYLACALADQACRKGIDAAYRRMSRLMHEMHVARHDGSYSKLLGRFAKMHLLIIDDWGITPLGDQERRDLLEVLEDRHGAKSTIIATQLPVDAWHRYIGDATVADAILDRVVHNAHKLDLKGASMRKVKTNLTSQEASA